MKILLTGMDGQIGSELNRLLPSIGKVFAANRSALDLRDGDAIRRLVRHVEPQVIVNAAAYTAVDQAECNRHHAEAVNAVAPEILAGEAKRMGALLVHYSTDYVFDGTKATPYNEDDPPNPINAYGESKLRGEQAISASGCQHYIFRTSWIYAPRGRNFLLTMLRLARDHAVLRIVKDQVGAPTWSRDVALSTVRMLQRPDYLAPQLLGIYHVCADGSTSWYGFAESIFRAVDVARLGISVPVLEGILSNAFPSCARRPTNSRLDCGRLASRTGLRLAHWEVALKQCIAELPPL
jgi:dTDP-4-dehydrorhamnose reductase